MALTENALVGAYIGEVTPAPTGYTYLQYVETNATTENNGSVLASGVNLSSNYCRIYMELRPLALRNNANYYIATDRANLTMEYYWGNRIFNIGSTSSLFVTNDWYIGTDYTIDLKLDNGTVTLNGDTATYGGSVSGHQNICFCGYPSGGGNVFVCSNNRLYAIKIYIGSSFTLVRDYVPAKRNSDQVAGMYDRVNDVFYESYSNYPFTAGPEI